MKHWMKSTATLLALTALTSTSSYASSFSDMNNHWSSTFVSTAVDAGLMMGMGNGTFSPDKSMSYAEFAVVVVNGAFDGEIISKQSDTHWGDPFLNVLHQYGLWLSDGETVVDMSNSNWKDQSISRKNAATIIARLMDRGNFITGEPHTGAALGDMNYLSAGQRQDVRDVIANGIMTGTGAVFGVDSPLTRGEACVMVSTMLEKEVIQSKNPNFSTPSTPEVETTPSTPEVESTPSTPEVETTPDVEAIQAQYAAEVFRLVNVERAKEGLSAYAWNDALMEASQFKSEEMSELNYFDHTSPVYGGFSGIINLYLKNYGGAGENIAQGYGTPAAVVNGWMNSDGHKKNILSSGFTQIGIGYADGYWTQQFTATAGTPVGSTTTPETTTPETTTPETTTPNTGTTTPETTTPETTTPDSSTNTSGTKVAMVNNGSTKVKLVDDQGMYYPQNSDPYRHVRIYFQDDVPEGMELKSATVNYPGAEVSSFFFHNDKDYCSVSMKNIPETVDDFTITLEFGAAYRCVLYSGGTVSYGIPNGNFQYIPNGTEITISYLDANTGSLEVKNSNGVTITPNKVEVKKSGSYTTTTEYFTVQNSNLHVYPALPGTSSTPSTGTTPDTTTPETTTPETTTPDTTTPDSSTTPNTQGDLIQGVFDLVNKERAAVGLNALLWHDDLMDAAQFKSEEMASLKYFSHTSPVYGSFTGIIRLYVTQYWTVGENIASGQSTAASVMNSWMNSSGHKDNILNKDFTHIGIGYANGYWTQQFIGT